MSECKSPGSIPLSTCLSPMVYKKVCELGFEVKGSFDISNILDKDNQVCWGTICGKVSHPSPGHDLDYTESVRQLGPLCDAVHLHFMSLPDEKFREAFQDDFSWTNNCEIFHNALSVLKSLNGTQISLLLMKITSCLEFSLGNVYLINGKHCPFLLRDLLATEELAKIFSKPVMEVIKVFLGSPKSLNLRNILWHGFASPQEIPSKYCSMLTLLTAGLGQLLQLCNKASTIVHRPYFIFHNLLETQVFSDVDDELLYLSEKLIEKSQIVLQHMATIWTEAIAAYKQGRYADCAILLLPQLETCLRLIFTRVNECPNRMLTAESTTLYTTFDEILAKNLNNASVNQVPHILGESAMEFLWDFLNHPEGPRVRDHLSHGEIQLSKFPKEIANDLLGFAIVLLYKHTGDDAFAEQETTVLLPLIHASEAYQSRCHPIAILQKQVLECSESLKKWELIPVPSLEVRGFEDNENRKSISSEVSQILSILQLHEKICICTKDLESWLQTDKWLNFTKEICSKKIAKLYCHRWVLEVVSILRKVSTQLFHVSSNIVSTSNGKYQQWLNKALRSRQRQNYLRMLCSIETLCSVLRLILILVVVNMHSVHRISEKTDLEYQKYLKYLKFILQYAENMSTCTGPEKNRWDEAMQLTSAIIVKTRMFLEKCKYD